MRKLTLALPYFIALALLIYVPAVAAQGTPAAKPSLPDEPKPRNAPAPSSQTPSQPPAAPNGPFKEAKENYSYALGLSIGENMKRQSVDLDLAAFDQGMKDGLGGGKALMTDEEVKANMNAFQLDLRARKEEKARAETAKAKQEGEAFLEANKSKPGVVVLPSGLQYKILTAGTGPKPAAADTVVCNYRGTFINGVEFDNSEKHGGPATFPVGRVIPGWTEALQLMPVGSKWQLFVPADLAYGARGAGADIPPNSALIFEVELLSIQGKQQPAQPKP